MTRLAALALIAALLPGAALAQDITVIGLKGETKVLTQADLAELPRASVPVTVKGKVKTYEGPILTYVLRAVGAPSAARMHGTIMKDYVVVTGADKFVAVYSLAETDKDFHEGTVILADKADGAPLSGKEAPYRTVLAGDKMTSRSVYGVAKIELKAVQ